MTVVGFIDKDDQPITFHQLRQGKGDWGGVPLALLRSLSNQYRQSDHYGDEDHVSVTTLLAPVRQTWLKKRHDTYVRPLDNIWAAYGTIAHGMFEANPAVGDIVEHKLMLKRGGIWIGGTFDLMEHHYTADTLPGMPEMHYGGKDYKVTSTYGVKQMLSGELSWNGDKSDYFWQAQLYKYMAEQPDVHRLVEVVDPGETLHGRVTTRKEIKPWEHAGMKVDSWELVAICRDWNQRRDGKTVDAPVQVIPVAPLLDNDRVENYLNQRLELYLASGMCEDDQLPDCTDKELWGYLPSGQGRRCSQWCEVSGVCNQNMRNLGLV